MVKKMVLKDSSRETLQILLKQPYIFYKVSTMANGRHHTGSELVNAIEDSSFRDFFKEFSDEEVNEIVDNFHKEMGIIREWFQNSDIRSQTFYHLGNKGSATSSEISEIINKHPKSVSTYIQEFLVKEWVVLVPDKDARKKRYRLSETGDSFLKYFEGMFEYSLGKEIYIEETILKIYWSMPIVLPDGTYYLQEVEGPDFVPDTLNDLILEIREISMKLLTSLKIELNIPKIRSVGPSASFLSIDSVDKDDLAIVLMSFNYINKNRIKSVNKSSVSLVPKIWDIKQITAESYLDDEMPYIDDKEGFLGHKPTKRFISKVLQDFKIKIKKGEEKAKPNQLD